mmetsp:Transcript_5485/g.11499  ORF Transcript_5485/g.11499 Transcript_5485/m.11499 type:complete len:217 (-) Transcript_5485:883-1533(-)
MPLLKRNPPCPPNSGVSEVLHPEQRPEKHPRVPHGVHENGDPQVPAQHVQQSPGNAERAQGQRGGRHLVVQAKEHARQGHADRQRKPEAERGQQKAAVEHLLPPRRRHAGGKARHRHGPAVVVFRVHHLHHHGLGQSVSLQQRLGEQELVQHVAARKHPARRVVAPHGPPQPGRAPLHGQPAVSSPLSDRRRRSWRHGSRVQVYRRGMSGGGVDGA